MRIHTGRCPARRRAVLLPCVVTASCAVLAACAAAPHKGPDTDVTAPTVGRPPPPASAQAALSSEAFTPYAGLGAVDNDGLAPGDTYDALHTACMNDAGYGQYASQAAYNIRTNSGFTFATPYGWQGYIGTALAAQQGFLAGTPFAPGAPAPGPGPGGPGNLLGNLPAAAQAAAGKCFNILENFNNAQFTHSMAIIETLNNDIGNAEVVDPSIKKAMANWSACMAKQGYRTSNANTFSEQAQVTLGLRPPPGPATGTFAPPGQPTAAQNKAQIAMAVADAHCTLTSDLSGIYFAVQASYEKQFVTANQQALNAGIREYKAAFAKALKDMPALLRAASATPNVPGPTAPGRHGKHIGTASPSPSHS
jgi:hypothetical protein